MRRRGPALIAVIGLLAAGTLGWLAATQGRQATEARAQDSEDETPLLFGDEREPPSEPAGTAPFRLRCRTFEIAFGTTLDLPTDDSEASQWIRDQSDFTIWAVDYEAVPKSNGYPMHMVQVCLTSG